MTRPPTAHGFAVLALAVVFALLVSSTMMAADAPVVSIDFQQTSVADAFRALKQFDPSLSYALSEEAANRTVTASLVEVPLPEAVKIIADHSGLAVREENGVYRIEEPPRPPVDEEYGPVRGPSPAKGPWTDEFAGTSRMATGAPATGSTPDEARMLRMIEIQHADAALLAELFGGTAIYGGETGYGGSPGGRSGMRGSDTGYSRGSSSYDRGSRGYDSDSGGYPGAARRY